MAFPTTSILDAFTRADENPLAGGWSANPVYFGGPKARLVSNQMAGLSTAAHPYWAATTAADCEAYYTIANRSGFASIYLYARGADFNTSGFTNDAYAVVCTSGNVFRLEKIVNDSNTTLQTTTLAVATGDSVGIRCVGTEITAWHKPAAGAWTLIHTATDGDITAGGLLGITASSTVNGTAFLDDFGGGDYSAGVTGRIGRLAGEGGGLIGESRGLIG